MQQLWTKVGEAGEECSRAGETSCCGIVDTRYAIIVGGWCTLQLVILGIAIMVIISSLHYD